MLARIDANALRSLMKFRGSVEWLVDVWDDMCLYDSIRLAPFNLGVRQSSKQQQLGTEII